jgi:Zinc carboxypeptidase
VSNVQFRQRPGASRQPLLRLFAFVLALLILVSPLGALAAPAEAPRSSTSTSIEPPWCGTPPTVPEWISTLPDGSNPNDPPGSFAHIPVYALACTLADIQARSNGRMETRVFGQSAGGHDLYLVTINALDTPQQRKDFQTWQNFRKIALTDPVRAQDMLDKAGDDVKVPIFIQSAIHGNEAEGVDAMFELVERLATTPYGADPEVDAILNHVILLWNVDQNPDGRISGNRGNANNFDLNRDFLTQSQPETQAAVSILQEWLPPDMLDQHGYVTPTLIESTTKPHNPSIDYDLWLKWNPKRIDANEAAMNAVGLGVTRPILDWCADGNPPPASGICANGQPPGPAQAEGWDDWGPFYTPMYLQLVGLNGSTVEMCNRTDQRCGVPGSTTHPLGRLGSKVAQYTVAWSTLLFDLENRHDLLWDELETYRRGITNAPRPECCEAPYTTDGFWMREYPKAYVIPLGPGQRSDAEANRLVDWLLFNNIIVDEMKQDTTFRDTTFAKGSYVVWMTQAHRGLADTALSIGTNISGLIQQLYAPPGAWSHGFLWGADTTVIQRDADFAPITNRVTKSSHLLGGVEPGVADAYVLAIDSPAAVRTLNALLAGGTQAQLAMASFASPSGDTLPAGSAIFAADPATKVALASAGRANDVWFSRAGASSLPPMELIDRVPRIAVLTSAVNQDVWSMRNLGFVADPIATGGSSQLNDPSAPNPLDGYDLVFNTAGWPSGATARTRLQAFFTAGGGYIGALLNGANFLTSAGLVTGLTTANRSGGGRSGIVLWNNEGGPNSPIVGAFPVQDTAIMDPPTWFTAIPGTMSVDGRLPLAGYFLAGLWQPDAQSASAPGSAVIAHGTSISGAARLTVFAMNPLYRADPEREWAMLASAAYWADK